MSMLAIYSKWIRRWWSLHPMDPVQIFSILFWFYYGRLVEGIEIKFDKIVRWSVDSGLELGQVCDRLEGEALIVDGLRVLSLGSKEPHVLKMNQMMVRESDQVPFPHYYRLNVGKKKGAVYADFWNVANLGFDLKKCRDRNVRVMLQVQIQNVVKLNRRKVILMSSLLWNSFLSANGEYHDHPFGEDVSFDGIHFIYDKTTAESVVNIMKKLRSVSESEGKSLILGSSSDNLKMIDDAVSSASDYLIISPDTKEPTSPFFVIYDAKKPKLIQHLQASKKYKGLAGISKKSNVISDDFLTKSSSVDSSETSCSKSTIAIIIIIFCSVITGIATYFIIKNYQKRKSNQTV